MKITIAYLANEESRAGTIERFIRTILGKVKVRRSDRHKPFYHIYITDITRSGRTRESDSISLDESKKCDIF